MIVFDKYIIKLWIESNFLKFPVGKFTCVSVNPYIIVINYF